MDNIEFYHPHPTLLEYPNNGNRYMFSLKEEPKHDYSFLILLTFGIFSKILSSNKIDTLMNKFINKLAIRFFDRILFYDDDYDLFTKSCNIKPPKIKNKPVLPFLDEIKKIHSTDSLNTVDLSDTEKDSFHIGWVDIHN